LPHRWHGRVDHRDDRRVVHFLDPGLLVVAAQRQVDLLVNVDLTPQAALFGRELGRLLPGAVALVEAAQVILGGMQLALAVQDALLDELAPRPRLRLALRRIELIEILDEPRRHGGREIGVARGDAVHRVSQ